MAANCPQDALDITVRVAWKGCLSARRTRLLQVTTTAVSVLWKVATGFKCRKNVVTLSVKIRAYYHDLERRK